MQVKDTLTKPIVTPIEPFIHQSTPALFKDIANAPSFTTLANVPMLTVIPSTLRPVKECPEFLMEELSTEELNRAQQFLWIAGPPATDIRPLHEHRALDRKITVCERIGLHLVTSGGKLFVKPSPKCFLSPDFFNEHVASDPYLFAQATGFMSSFLRLIKHECDFKIARELGLLPDVIAGWSDWLTFAEDIRSKLPQMFCNRFDYGELSWSYVSLIMRLQPGHFCRGYQPLHPPTTSYLDSFLSFIAYPFPSVHWFIALVAIVVFFFILMAYIKASFL